MSGMADSPGAAGPDRDPGWRDVITPWFLVGLVLGMIPFLGRRVMQRALRGRSQDGLLMLRQLFLHFLVAVLLIGMVAGVVSLDERPSSTEQQVAVILLVALGTACLAAAEWFGRKPLDCSDDAHLAVGYRSRFFLRIAFSEAVALFGFVSVFVVGRWWLYWVGAAFTLVGFARLAPTAANLTADQWRLTQAGCTRSLVEVLSKPSGDKGGS
jgi:hypothetical protein